MSKSILNIQRPCADKCPLVKWIKNTNRKKHKWTVYTQKDIHSAGNSINRNENYNGMWLFTYLIGRGESGYQSPSVGVWRMEHSMQHQSQWEEENPLGTAVWQHVSKPWKSHAWRLVGDLTSLLGLRPKEDNRILAMNCDPLRTGSVHSNVLFPPSQAQELLLSWEGSD